MIKRKCLLCGKRFETTRSNKRCCSAICSKNKWQRKNPRWINKYLKNKNKTAKQNHKKRYYFSKKFLKKERLNKSYCQIAKENGVSYEWIRKLCILFGIKKRKLPTRKKVITKGFLIEHLPKYSIEKIARGLGCSVLKIGYWINKHGLNKMADQYKQEQRRIEVIDKFWNNVDRFGPWIRNKREIGRCWLWTGLRFPNGHGRFLQEFAHQASYRIYVGEIPKDSLIIHKCSNRLCVNPVHLEVRVEK